MASVVVAWSEASCPEALAFARVRVVSGVVALAGAAVLVLSGVFAPVVWAYDSPAYDRGMAEMGRGDFDGAIISFGETIGFDMNNKRAYSKRGQCFFHLKNYRDALTDFDHLLQMDPRDSQAYLWRGTTYSKLGMNEKAVNDYLSAIRLDPRLSENYDNRSHTDGAQSSSSSSNSGLVAGGAGSESGAPSGNGDSQLITEEGTSLPRHRQQRVGNPEAVDDYKRAMEIYHQQLRGAEVDGQSGPPSSTDAGQKRRASSTRAKRAARDNPDTNLNHNPSTSDPQASGVAPQAGGQPLPLKTARVEQDRSAASKFETYNPPEQKSDTTLSQGQQRIDELTDAMRENPDDSTLYLKRGRLFRQIGNDDKALSDFNDAIRIDPMNWRAYVARARIYNDHNEPDLRDIDLKHARTLNRRLPKHLTLKEDEDSQKQQQK